jgi:hypothetical protein
LFVAAANQALEGCELLGGFRDFYGPVAVLEVYRVVQRHVSFEYMLHVFVSLARQWPIIIRPGRHLL